MEFGQTDASGEPIDHADFLFSSLLDLPKFNPVDARIVLTELYETKYGIFDHTSPEAKKNPLASVGMHFGEHQEIDATYEEIAGLYIDKNIQSLFQYNLKEFMALPKYRIQSLFRVADSQRAKRAVAEKEARDVIDQNLGGKKR